MADQLPPVDGVAGGPDRRFRFILLASLALNVAIVCAVAGYALAGRTNAGPPRGFELSLGPIAAALNREDRRDIRDRLQERGGMRPLSRREAQAQMQAMVDALRVAPFDPTAVDAFFQATRQRSANLQAVAQDALIEKLVAMTPDERDAFASRLEDELQRRGPRRP